MRLRAALFIAVIVLLPIRALAQCKVQGVVRQAGGGPVAGATVVIEIPDPVRRLTTTTDEAGQYVFENIKPGVRVRVVVSQGGRSVVQAFTLVTLWVEKLDIEIPPERSRPMSTEDLDPAGGPAGDVGGVVRSADGVPVPAARVAINQTDLTTLTDSAGRYAFGELRSGVLVGVNVSATGFDPATKEVLVPSDSRAVADVALTPGFPESTSGAELGMLETPADANGARVSPAQVAGIPSLGQRDVFRGLQFLPGTPASMEASANLYVRGGTPGENLVTYDGFTLYQFDHLLANLSPLNMEAVRSADFSGAASEVGEGGRLSGSLRLTGQSNPAGKVTGSFGVSLLGASGIISVPFGRRGSFLFAARRSFTGSRYNDILDYLVDEGAPSARDRVPRYSGGTFLTSASSSFSDWNGKLELKVSAKDRVSLSVYDGRDDFNDSRDLPLQRSTGVAPPSSFDLPSDAVSAFSDIRNWTGRGASAAWSRNWSQTVSTTFSVGRSVFSWAHDQASLLTSPSTGKDYSFAAGRGGSHGWSETNDVRDTTGRLDATVVLGFNHALTLGGEIASVGADYTLLREVVKTTASPPGYGSTLDPLLDQTALGRLVTFYAQDSWRPFAELVVSPGLRVSRYDLTRSTYAEPRVTAAYHVAPGFRVHGRWGIDHQVANQVTREDLMEGDSRFWSLSDGTNIPVASALQAAVGATVERSGVLVGGEVYAKNLSDLTVFAPRLLPGVAPAPDSRLFHQGTGRANGFEWMLQWKSNRNTLWTGYTASLAEYTFFTLEPSAFPASHDQRHELKVADSARIASRWSVSATWVVASGRPYTPTKSVGPVWFPSGATLYEVTFGAKNSARLPAYHRLDVSTQHDFRVGGFKSTIGATVFNVYDRANIGLLTYQTVGDALTVNDVTMMRRAVNVFVKVGF